MLIFSNEEMMLIFSNEEMMLIFSVYNEEMMLIFSVSLAGLGQCFTTFLSHSVFPCPRIPWTKAVKPLQKEYSLVCSRATKPVKNCIHSLRNQTVCILF